MNLTFCSSFLFLLKKSHVCRFAFFSHGTIHRAISHSKKKQQTNKKYKPNIKTIFFYISWKCVYVECFCFIFTWYIKLRYIYISNRWLLLCVPNVHIQHPVLPSIRVCWFVGWLLLPSRKIVNCHHCRFLVPI